MTNSSEEWARVDEELDKLRRTTTPKKCIDERGVKYGVHEYVVYEWDSAIPHLGAQGKALCSFCKHQINVEITVREMDNGRD